MRLLYFLVSLELVSVPLPRVIGTITPHTKADLGARDITSRPPGSTPSIKRTGRLTIRCSISTMVRRMKNAIGMEVTSRTVWCVPLVASVGFCSFPSCLGGDMTCTAAPDDASPPFPIGHPGGFLAPLPAIDIHTYSLPRYGIPQFDYLPMKYGVEVDLRQALGRPPA